jgi:hypothetical protein
MTNNRQQLLEVTHEDDHFTPERLLVLQAVLQTATDAIGNVLMNHAAFIPENAAGRLHESNSCGVKRAERILVTFYGDVENRMRSAATSQNSSC